MCDNIYVGVRLCVYFIRIGKKYAQISVGFLTGKFIAEKKNVRTRRPSPHENKKKIRTSGWRAIYNAERL